MTLYRLHPPVFHAEPAFWSPEQTRFGVQRCHDQLTSQPHHLLDESLQTLSVELCGRVIQQQGRSGLRHLLEQPQLCDGHGRRDQFLLSPRKNLSGRTTVQPHGNVGTVRAGVNYHF